MEDYHLSMTSFHTFINTSLNRTRNIRSWQIDEALVDWEFNILSELGFDVDYESPFKIIHEIERHLRPTVMIDTLKKKERIGDEWIPFFNLAF